MTIDPAGSKVDGPAALFRGGDFGVGAGAGVFAVNGLGQPSITVIAIGFRCAR